MRMLVSLDGYVSRFLAVLALGPLVPMVGCGTSTGGSTLPCDGATPIEVLGQDSGYVQCEGEWVHRPQVVQCGSLLPRDLTCDNATLGGDCSQDSDCTEKPNGYCGGSGFEGPYCGCNYGCIQDSDCEAGQICVCGDPVGQCVTASCASDADCGEGVLCATYITVPGCGGFAFACQSPLDECGGDGDCPQGTQCTLVGDHRECGEINCAIGRPFLVEGEARVADVARRDDWCARDVAPRVDLPADVRRVLAEEWARSGQMEHASIAAFARFSMQLLALGAPPDLLVATHAAMADETDHALACFALASAYSGAPTGPGRLAMEGALADVDLTTAVRLAIREGCVGETVAAVEAAEASRHAEDPAVRAVLAKIAEDETRHAELAWRFVRWALSSAPELHGAVESEFAAVLAEERARPSVLASAEDQTWLAHGVARGTVKAELRRRLVDAVVAPAARALLSRRPAAAAAMEQTLTA